MRHDVSGSDHISKIALQHKKNWREIWKANGSLNRSNPNILFKGFVKRNRPGDKLTIPDVNVGSVKRGDKKYHAMEVKAPEQLYLRLRILRDDLFTPIAGAKFTLKVSGPSGSVEASRETDSKGQIEQKIPSDAQEAELTVRIKFEDSEPSSGGGGGGGGGGGAGGGGGGGGNELRGEVPVTWKLKVGALNPIMEKAPDKYCIGGVQQRLNNLCLNTGPVDGILGPNTRAAVKAFQDIYGLDVDGIPGQVETQPKLFEVHDKPDSLVKPPPKKAGP